MPVAGLCLLLLTLPPLPGTPELPVAPEDLAWLPPREVAREQRLLAGEFRSYLEARAAVDNGRCPGLEDALDWARHCYRAWDALEDAQLAGTNHEWQLQSLEKLRDEIGPAAYLAGQLPLVVGRFARID